MARPTDCTPELTAALCAELRVGMSIKAACQHVGLDDSTFRRWMQRGEDGEEPFATFRAQATRAKSDGVRALVVTVRKAASSDWRAAAWILERRAPEDWTKRTEITGPEGGPIQIEQVRAAVDAELAGRSAADLGIPDDVLSADPRESGG